MKRVLYPERAATPAIMPVIMLILLGLLAACISGSASVYPGPHHAPTNPAEVQVYRFFPNAPAERIGEVEVIGPTGSAWDRFQNELKEKAASIGGQAVVVVGERSQLLSIYESPARLQTFQTPGARQAFLAPGEVYPQEESHILGIVLRFPEGQAPVPPKKP
ncbi:MAG: hypothetical protein V2A77_00190 [Pseudomonadota bacterium]